MEWIISYIWFWPPKVGQSTDITKASKLFNILWLTNTRVGLKTTSE